MGSGEGETGLEAAARDWVKWLTRSEGIVTYYGGRLSYDFILETPFYCVLYRRIT